MFTIANFPQGKNLSKYLKTWQSKHHFNYQLKYSASDEANKILYQFLKIWTIKFYILVHLNKTKKMNCLGNKTMFQIVLESFLLGTYKGKWSVLLLSNWMGVSRVSSRVQHTEECGAAQSMPPPCPSTKLAGWGKNKRTLLPWFCHKAHLVPTNCNSLRCIWGIKEYF